jgi:hypothetical protein
VVFHGWSARFYLPSIHLYRPPPTGGAEARAAWPLAEVHPGVVCAGHARRQACERRARAGAASWRVPLLRRGDADALSRERRTAQLSAVPPACAVAFARKSNREGLRGDKKRGLWNKR